MELKEFEFLGKDRYFKYRYAKETPINITTVTETWKKENQVSFYKIMGDYLQRSLNMKSIYEGHKVNFLNASKIYTAPDVFNNANFILIPVSRSFFAGRQKYFSPSPVFNTARTIIVSAAPKRVMSTSLSFLNMDTELVILTVSTVLLLSLLLVIHSFVTNKYKSLPTKKAVKKLAQETVGNVWDNASLFCAEPIPVVSPHITSRLLVSSWLIGVTFILVFLGCSLHTDFTTESYNCIDTLSDLIKSGIPPTLIKETGTLDHLKVLASKDPVVRKWLDTLDQKKIFSNPLEYFQRDGFIPILSGEKALITRDPFLVWAMGTVLITDSESKDFFASKGGFYFSQHEVGFEYLHFIYNTSWIRSSPLVHENAQLSLEPIFETQVFNHMQFQLSHVIEQVTWKRPLKSTVALDLSSVIVPFYMLFMLMSGTVSVVITEIFLNHFA